MIQFLSPEQVEELERFPARRYVNTRPESGILYDENDEYTRLIIVARDNLEVKLDFFTNTPEAHRLANLIEDLEQVKQDAIRSLNVAAEQYSETERRKLDEAHAFHQKELDRTRCKHCNGQGYIIPPDLRNEGIHFIQESWYCRPCNRKGFNR